MCKGKVMLHWLQVIQALVRLAASLWETLALRRRRLVNEVLLVQQGLVLRKLGELHGELTQEVLLVVVQVN